ncbi:hypothetical protein E2C01_008355 [Portunus trituberculatus]|uniref:Uncharacterized protein n=1 Tax=Portunus trituberculatus TaxID=210409 RepID=A0A5B7D1J7_PORTR|nr:hypothetical protein [Portunus trituberculatus]
METSYGLGGRRREYCSGECTTRDTQKLSLGSVVYRSILVCFLYRVTSLELLERVAVRGETCFLCWGWQWRARRGSPAKRGLKEQTGLDTPLDDSGQAFRGSLPLAARGRSRMEGGRRGRTGRENRFTRDPDAEDAMAIKEADQRAGVYLEGEGRVVCLRDCCIDHSRQRYEEKNGIGEEGHGGDIDGMLLLLSEAMRRAGELRLGQTDDLTLLAAVDHGSLPGEAGECEAYDPLEAPGTVAGRGVVQTVFLDV